MLQRPFCINSSIPKAVHAKKNLNFLGEQTDGRTDKREENNIPAQLRCEGITIKTTLYTVCYSIKRYIYYL